MAAESDSDELHEHAEAAASALPSSSSSGSSTKPAKASRGARELHRLLQAHDDFHAADGARKPRDKRSLASPGPRTSPEQLQRPPVSSPAPTAADTNSEHAAPTALLVGEQFVARCDDRVPPKAPPPPRSVATAAAVESLLPPRVTRLSSDSMLLPNRALSEAKSLDEVELPPEYRFLSPKLRARKA